MCLTGAPQSLRGRCEALQTELGPQEVSEGEQRTDKGAGDGWGRHRAGRYVC